MCKSIKLLKLHNRKMYKNAMNNNSKWKQDDIVLNIDNIDSITNNGYFPNLQNEENWISFSNNLYYLKKKIENLQWSFIKKI